MYRLSSFTPIAGETLCLGLTHCYLAIPCYFESSIENFAVRIIPRFGSG